MRARAISVAEGIFRPADSGRTEYVLALWPDDLHCAGGVDDDPSARVLDVAVEEADGAAPAQDAAFGEDGAGTDRFHEADLELERRHGAGEAALGDRGVRHGDVDHAGQEAALADAALGVTEGRHDLEAAAAYTAL